MFIPQTLDEYLENPMGKGSTAIANRNLIKSDLDARYEKLITKHKEFKHTHYHDATNFYIHIQVPSETEQNNTYDVVIQFTPTDNAVIHDVNLNRYTIKVFSNCPSFTYTYAYVYNDYGLMIDFLRNKYKNVVLSDNPVVKNPGEIINFEKSIYFACKFIKANKPFTNKVLIAPKSKRINIEQFKKTIRNTDAIDIEIKKETNRLKDEKKKALDKAFESTPKKIMNKITGGKVAKSRSDHRVTPHAKIRGKAKVKSTIKK